MGTWTIHVNRSSPGWERLLGDVLVAYFLEGGDLAAVRVEFYETVFGQSETSAWLSPCCEEPIYASCGDGVLIGSCSDCHKNVLRINPRTGVEEWLDGASPWTYRDLRPVGSVSS